MPPINPNKYHRFEWFHRYKIIFYNRFFIDLIIQRILLVRYKTYNICLVYDNGMIDNCSDCYSNVMSVLKIWIAVITRAYFEMDFLILIVFYRFTRYRYF